MVCNSTKTDYILGGSWEFCEIIQGNIFFRTPLEF